MNSKSVKPIPEGMHTVTPYLVCAGAAEAIDFYQAAFGAEELSRLPGPDGKIMHAALRIGNSVVMMTEEAPDWNSLGPQALKGTPVTIHLYVPDVDDCFARAVKAGARQIIPVNDMFWGDRYGVVEDPFGHRWSMATHTRDLTPEELRKALSELPPMCPETPMGPEGKA